MIVLGIGAMIGGPIVGFTNDRLGGGKAVAILCLIMVALSYLGLVIANEIHEFGFLCYFSAFMQGALDSAVNTQLFLILGFEFKTNTEPFAVFRLLWALGNCLVLLLATAVTSLAGFRWFFIICGIVSAIG